MHGFERWLPEIEDFSKRWNVAAFAVFGSVLREDFNENSDVDVLLTPGPEARWSALDLVGMQFELEAVFGRSVDVLTSRGVAMSRNKWLRDEITRTARVLYAAA
jgi:predicted nucleotidyltransferase